MTITKEQKESSMNQYIPVEEFAELKKITPEKVIQMIKDGFYQGQIIDDNWHVMNAEVDSDTSSNFFSKLAGGEFGLARTYWLYGVFIGFSANVLSTAITSIAVLVVFIVVFTAYETLVLLGIWRAADKYQGRRAWTVLAKIAVVLGAIMLLSGIYKMVGLLNAI